MSLFQVHDPAFDALHIGHARLEHLWTGGRWLEGPAYFPAGRYLIFSDIPSNRLMRYDETSGAVSVFRDPSRNANGNTVDTFGRLVTCEHQSRSITRTAFDGSVTVLADRIDGKQLNSPNDIAVSSDGAIWFTDPTYGIDSDYEGDAAPSDLGVSYVYRIDPSDGSVGAVIRDRVRPNGLCFSPDEKTLYVADTGATHVPGLTRTISRYDADIGAGTATHAATFATLDVAGFFDGLRADIQGNIWTSAGQAVRCYAPDGRHLATLPIPEIVSNLCFGGLKKNRLFITAQTSLYAVFVNVRGAG